jgi:hypothetical protein
MGPSMNLPLSKAQVTKGAAWLHNNFAAQIAAAIEGKPYSAPIVCAIACKETGFIWIPRTEMAPGDLLPLLVGDASGDIEGHPRHAFPQNTEEFRDQFGDDFTSLLTDESNAARALRGLGPAHIVYKGYGIFQYDLQHVMTDEVFFRNRLWHRIEGCLDRLTRELDRCFDAADDDTHDAVRRYNGSGSAAETYADHVMAFADFCTGVA